MRVGHTPVYFIRRHTVTAYSQKSLSFVGRHDVRHLGPSGRDHYSPRMVRASSMNGFSNALV
jgi:hypothetical protein